ncbi:MAG: amidohydrolase family protein [Lautropia sp.]
MSRKGATAIVDGLIIDGTGNAPIADGLVLIEDDRIRYAGTKRGQAIPSGATIIDAGGATVLPGLMDVHVHISLNGPANIHQELLSRPLGRVAFEITRNLRDTVAAGTTTIRTVSDLAHLDIAARDSIDRGVMVGPRMHPCGKGLTTTGGHGDLMPCWLCQSHGDVSETVDGVDAVRAAVRRQVKAGASWIKLFQTGGVIDPHGRIDAEEFSPSEFDAAFETAKLAGVPVAVHAHNKVAILHSIRAGCRSIEHGMHFDQECARVAREHGAWLVPTLTVMDRILKLGAENGVPQSTIDNVRERTAKHREYVKYAFDLGANIASGTDAGSMLTPHGSAGREVVQLVRCGLTVEQAIFVATLSTARLLAVDDRLGTLAAGKLADVVVCDGDLTQQLENLESAANARHVLIGGRRVAAGGRALVN